MFRHELAFCLKAPWSTLKKKNDKVTFVRHSSVI